jgi:polysaccharide biosynthesis protein PslJ
MRVYELARELGCETRDVIEAAQHLGIVATSPLSGVDTKSEAQLRADLEPTDPETVNPVVFHVTDVTVPSEADRETPISVPAPPDLDRVTPRFPGQSAHERYSSHVRRLSLMDSQSSASAGKSTFEGWTFILIVLYLVLNRVIPDRFVLPVGSSVRVYELVLVLILGVWLLWMIVDPLPFPNGLLGITGLGLVAVLALAPFLSALEMTPFQINGAQRGLVRVVLFAGMFMAAYHLAHRLRSGRLLLSWVLGLTAFQAVLSVWEYLTETPLYFFDDFATSIGLIPDPNNIRGEFELFTRLTGEVRAVVTAPHPIVLSALIALGVLISAGWLVHERGNKGRRWVMVATAVLLIGLPVSNSRTGFVILVVATVPFLILASRNLVRMIPLSLGVAVVFVAAFIVSPQTPRLLLNSFTNPDQDHNTQVRLSKFDSIPELIADRPFFGTGYLTHDPTIQIFDNAYNLALVETGIIGLAFFVLFFVLILSRCWSAFRSASKREAILPFAGLVAAMTVLVGGATFDAWTFDQFFPTALIIMGLGAGRSAVIQRRVDRPQPEALVVGSRHLTSSR